MKVRYNSTRTEVTFTEAIDTSVPFAHKSEIVFTKTYKNKYVKGKHPLAVFNRELFLIRNQNI